MNIGWTGAQYAIARVILAVVIVVTAWRHIADEPMGMVVAGAAIGLAVMLAIGWYDRAAAAVLAMLVGIEAWTGLQGVADWTTKPGVSHLLARGIVVLLLLAHAMQRPAPYGSWAARGRPDPGNGWAVRPAVFVTLWVVMAGGYAGAGIAMLLEEGQAWRMGDALAEALRQQGGRVVMPQLLSVATWLVLALHLAFAPLALVKRLRPWLWGAMVVVNLALMLTFDTQGLRLALLLLHVFTFNPAWIAPLPRRRDAEEMPEWALDQRQPETIFYDGYCGLCHRWVRFALAEDRSGEAFRFSPLQSRAFEQAVPAARRAELPDSIVVLTEDQRLLSRSDAVSHIARRLGGIWRPMGVMLAILPRFIRDGGYSFVAAIRHRIFKKPSDACPMLPPELRKRFVFESIESGR